MRTFEEITKKMADIELDPQTHGNDIEDYENEQDFYMENVQADSYEEYLKTNLQLWKAIENFISENCRPE
jgi:hypothetical protein